MPHGSAACQALLAHEAPPLSPSPPRPLDNSSQGYDDWMFMSTHFWDENPQGLWALGLWNKGYYFNTGEDRAWGAAQGPGRRDGASRHGWHMVGGQVSGAAGVQLLARSRCLAAWGHVTWDCSESSVVKGPRAWCDPAANSLSPSLGPP